MNLCYAMKNVDICNLLPTMTLELKNGNKCRKVDCGSQRSCITKKVSKYLCPSYNDLYELQHDIHTCIGEETNIFKQMSTGVRIGKSLVCVPLLVDSTMDITYEIHGMNYVMDKFTSNNIDLADEAFYNECWDHENIRIDMLMGIDMLQCVTLSIQNMCGGYCGPVGNIFNVLTSDQRKTLFNSCLLQHNNRRYNKKNQNHAQFGNGSS